MCKGFTIYIWDPLLGWVKYDQQYVSTILGANASNNKDIYRESGYNCTYAEIEMLDLVDQGVISASDLDRAVRGSLAIRWAAAGPMRVGDFGGWDVLGKVYENIAPSLRSDSQVHDILTGMISRGEYGIKSGQGFYEYPQQYLPDIIARKDKRFMTWAKLLSDSITSGEWRWMNVKDDRI